MPVPDRAADYACYNWRMTDHWWRESPLKGAGQMDQGTLFAERWPAGYKPIPGLTLDGEPRNPGWRGRPGGPNPPALVFATRRPANAF